jgi:sugar/nucleoside kinase (ribokinase family)
VPGTIYAVGSVLVDLTVDVPSLPERGGDLLATSTRTEAGGGFNLAAAVARQDVPCVYAGPHGTGPYGDQVRAALAAEGIRVASPRRTGGDTGFCITLVEPDGERTFVTMPGVDAELSPADLDSVEPEVGDIVSISGYDLAYAGSGPVLAGWVGSLPDGTFVALDPGPLVRDIPAELLARVLGRVSLLTMNQREARLLGVRPGGAGGLVGLTALVVVREGAAGCVATGGALGDQVVSVAAPAVTAVDTTGAGDAHTGVLLAALASGVPVAAALTLANRAAAISVTRVGPATAPTKAELGPA